MAGDALNFLSRETFRVPDLDGMQFEPVGNEKKKLIKKAPICHYPINLRKKKKKLKQSVSSS